MGALILSLIIGNPVVYPKLKRIFPYSPTSNVALNPASKSEIQKFVKSGSARVDSSFIELSTLPNVKKPHGEKEKFDEIVSAAVKKQAVSINITIFLYDII
jgi:predicted NAD/FAD-binding protein